MTCRFHATPIERCMGCTGRFDRDEADRLIAEDMDGNEAAAMQAALDEIDRLGTALWQASTSASVRGEAVESMRRQREADADEVALTFEAMSANIARMGGEIERLRGDARIVFGSLAETFRCMQQVLDIAQLPIRIVREDGNRDPIGAVRALVKLIDELRCGDLVPFTDGELSPERADGFRDHLTRCETCRRELPKQEALGAGLSQLAELEPTR